MKKLKNSFVFRNNFCVLYFQKIKKCQSCITLADEVWNTCFAFKNNESWSAFMYLVNRNENVKFGGTPLNAKIYIFWYFFGCNVCAGIKYCTIVKIFSLLLPCATATFCHKYHEICERGCEKFLREITLLKLVCNSNDIAPCMRSQIKVRKMCA